MSDADAYERGLRDAVSIVEQLAAVAPATLISSTGGGVTMKRLADAIAILDPARLRVLRPYDPREAIGVKEAAARAAVSESAIRSWCERYAIGRRVVGSLLVSAPALSMLLDDDVRALAQYLAGNRSSPVVRPYLDLAAKGARTGEMVGVGLRRGTA